VARVCRARTLDGKPAQRLNKLSGGSPEVLGWLLTGTVDEGFETCSSLRMTSVKMSSSSGSQLSRSEYRLGKTGYGSSVGVPA
jgi:hypothetical protein